MVVDNKSEITAAEQKLIKEFREKIEDELPAKERSKSDEDLDLYLVRWLRARDLNLNKATEMLRGSLEWRKNKNADQALTFEVDPFLVENFKFTLTGTDKDGNPILLIPLCEWDFRKIVNNDKIAEFDIFVINFFESIVAAVWTEHKKRKADHLPITKFTVIADTKDFPYSQILSFGAMKKLLQLASTYEAHYPEVLNTCVFINCPSYFGLFINLLKPVIAPKTLAKLVTYPSFTDWQANIENLADPAVVPERYGGTAKDV